MNEITTETIDQKIVKFKAEFDKGNAVLAKLHEQAQNIAKQRQMTMTQMQNIQGAILSLEELKADATGEEVAVVPDDVITEEVTE